MNPEVETAAVALKNELDSSAAAERRSEAVAAGWPGSLYNIEATIVSLFALLDEAEADGDAKAREVIEGQIKEWVGAELRKVDGIATFIRESEHRAELAKEEAQRLADRAKHWQAKADRLRACTMEAMNAHGIRKLETPASSLTVVGNGGLQPLDRQDDLIPNEYKLFIATLNHKQWRAFLEQYPGFIPRAVEVDTAAIREALHERVPCPDHATRSGPVVDRCRRCSGTGTVPREVPGAHLLPRGQHLRVG